MKKSMILAVVLALAGCTSLETAGHAGYSVRANAAGGWDFDAKDGAEFSGRRFEFNAQTGTLAVEEGASKKFGGQALAVKALTILPVNDLPALLGK